MSNNLTEKSAFEILNDWGELEITGKEAASIIEKEKQKNGASKTKRPYAQPNAQRRSIYTDAETWEALKKLGNGSASAGIREAVRKAEEREDEH